MDMLIKGQNSNDITSWLGISYVEYSKNRKSILKKLQIKGSLPNFNEIEKVSKYEMGFER